MTQLLHSDHLMHAACPPGVAARASRSTAGFGDRKQRAPRTSLIDAQWDAQPVIGATDMAAVGPIAVHPPRTSLIDAEWDTPPVVSVSGPTLAPAQESNSTEVTVETDTTSIRGALDALRRIRGRALLGIATALSLTLIQPSDFSGTHLNSVAQFRTTAGNTVLPPAHPQSSTMPSTEVAPVGHAPAVPRASVSTSSSFVRTKLPSSNLVSRPRPRHKIAAPAAPSAIPEHLPRARQTGLSRRFESHRQQFESSPDSIDRF